jgi:hypothetical protein
MELRRRNRLDAVVVQHDHLRARRAARIRSNFGDAAVTAARLRGQDYLLERRLFHRKSTGEPIEQDRKSGASWLRFAFPTWWHYDLLRALDYLREACVVPTSASPTRSTSSRRSATIREDGRSRRNTREDAGGHGRGGRPAQPMEYARAWRVLDWYSTRADAGWWVTALYDGMSKGYISTQR